MTKYNALRKLVTPLVLAAGLVANQRNRKENIKDKYRAMKGENHLH